MFILGKGGRHFSEADALDHVFGYTEVNDGSLRDNFILPLNLSKIAVDDSAMV